MIMVLRTDVTMPVCTFIYGPGIGFPWIAKTARRSSAANTFHVSDDACHPTFSVAPYTYVCMDY